MGWAEWEASSGKDMVQELVINYHSPIPRLESITIVVSDAEGEREGSEHVLEDSDWDYIDNYETPRHRMGLRTRRVVQGGTGRLFRISRIRTEGKGVFLLF